MGKTIILVSVGIFVILFLAGLFIAIYQHEHDELSDENINKEIDEMIKEWCAENKKAEKRIGIK